MRSNRSEREDEAGRGGDEEEVANAAVSVAPPKDCDMQGAQWCVPMVWLVLCFDWFHASSSWLVTMIHPYAARRTQKPQHPASVHHRVAHRGIVLHRQCLYERPDGPTQV